MTRSFARMLPRPIVGLAVACTLVWAGHTAHAQDFPFTGIIVEDNVQVRAGAGRAYYVVGELDRGDVVEVEEVIFGWNKVRAPKGVYSYISKAFVDARGDGKTGEVNSDRVEVKAASIKGPGESYRGQVVLNRGAVVEIVGSEGSFYKITPPRDAFVFLPPGSVRRASAVEAEQQPARPEPAPPPAADPEPVTPEPPPPAEAEPAVDPAPAVDPVATEPESEPTTPAADPQPTAPAASSNPEPTAPVAVTDAGPAAADAEPEPAAGADSEPAVVTLGDAEPVAVEPVAETIAMAPPATQPAAVDAAADNAGDGEPADAADAGRAPVEVPIVAVSEALREVERQYLPMFSQPLEEQPIDEMITAYQQVGEQPDLPNFDQRLVRQRLAALRHNRELAETLREIRALRETVSEEPPAPEPQGPPQYDAVGTLLASSVYDGRTLPRMYRLVDPASGRTIAYVEPGRPVDPGRMLGKVVGIVGEQRYDPALKLQVIEVDQIDLLEAARVAG